MAVHLEKGKNVFDKAIYVGFTVLELSKVLLYNLHYDVMIKIYGTENIHLLYMDTDSLMKYTMI